MELHVVVACFVALGLGATAGIAWAEILTPVPRPVPPGYEQVAARVAPAPLTPAQARSGFTLRVDFAVGAHAAADRDVETGGGTSFGLAAGAFHSSRVAVMGLVEGASASSNQLDELDHLTFVGVTGELFLSDRFSLAGGAGQARTTYHLPLDGWPETLTAARVRMAEPAPSCGSAASTPSTCPLPSPAGSSTSARSPRPGLQLGYRPSDPEAPMSKLTWLALIAPGLALVALLSSAARDPAAGAAAAQLAQIDRARVAWQTTAGPRQAVDYARAVHEALAAGAYRVDPHRLGVDLPDSIRALDQATARAGGDEAHLVAWRGLLLADNAQPDDAAREFARSLALGPTALAAAGWPPTTAGAGSWPSCTRCAARPRRGWSTASAST
ncbi:MAG: hypothetical protein HS111_29255 [Kofleriaceae bacterium]|nr:hypothetical protein [Kofleriaceae bacterium]